MGFRGLRVQGFRDCIGVLLCLCSAESAKNFEGEAAQKITPAQLSPCPDRARGWLQECEPRQGPRRVESAKWLADARERPRCPPPNFRSHGIAFPLASKKSLKSWGVPCTTPTLATRAPCCQCWGSTRYTMPVAKRQGSKSSETPLLPGQSRV